MPLGDTVVEMIKTESSLKTQVLVSKGTAYLVTLTLLCKASPNGVVGMTHVDRYNRDVTAKGMCLIPTAPRRSLIEMCYTSQCQSLQELALFSFFFSPTMLSSYVSPTGTPSRFARHCAREIHSEPLGSTRVSAEMERSAKAVHGRRSAKAPSTKPPCTL